MTQHSPQLQANASKAKEWFWVTALFLPMAGVMGILGFEIVSWVGVLFLAGFLIAAGVAWSFTSKVRRAIDNKSWNPYESLPPPSEP